MFDNVVGNSAVKGLLEKIIVKGRVPHLLLFSGPGSVGKRFLAHLFAREWLKSITENFIDREHHPDIHEFTAEGKSGMHSVQSIRELIEKNSYKPYEAGGKVFIVDHADRMLPASSNALLKTIEEPSENTVIILITSKSERLLATIRSRCQLFRFRPLTDEEANLVKQKESENEASYEELKLKLFEHLRMRRAYHEFSALFQEIQKSFDEKKKELEKELTSQYQDALKEMNATQRHRFEQEVEGAIAAQTLQTTERLLQDLHGFFRDLVALACTKEDNRPKLMHDIAYYEGLGRQDVRPLDKVAKAIAQAKLALERSTPLQNALESILLSVT